MDGTLMTTRESPTVLGEAARASLLERTEELRRAAGKFGIRPGHPESHLIAGLIGTQLAFGDMAVEMGEAVTAAVAKAQEHTKAETKRLQEMIALADQTIRQTKAAGVVAEAEVDKVLAEVVAQLGPEIVKVLRDTVVVKELRHNKRLHLLEYVKAGALVTAIFLAGYSVHVWQSWDATSAVDRCKANMEVNAAGRGYCAADRMFTSPTAVARTDR